MEATHRLPGIASLGLICMSLACGSAVDERRSASLRATESPVAEPSDRRAAASPAPVALQKANAFETHSLGAGGGCPCSYSNGLSGVIEVANLAYKKDVAVRVQRGADAGWDDVPARYFGPGPAGRDLFVFEVPRYGTGYAPGSFRFAVRYTVAGATYWDNNGGWNYQIKAPYLYRAAEGEAVLGSAAVGLGYAYTWNQELAGGVLVKDLGAGKRVDLVYTLDGWRTSATLAAAYDQPGEHGQEWWRFTLPLPSQDSVVEFAVSYRVGGATYWDNNLGANYRVTGVYQFPR